MIIFLISLYYNLIVACFSSKNEEEIYSFDYYALKEMYKISNDQELWVFFQKGCILPSGRPLCEERKKCRFLRDIREFKCFKD
ncbi:hypothetical protein PVAND_014158 [Polypedilum vanderplanki]|uniref:Uncharacterized protein n=1 Tax=Polypedilum vanderplanki TaxID=319348 RepID=A0A9J6CSU3_POLVA|nr:hypothetical protein PVAND_014158 [Polypedilum vanderplanki]